MQSLRLKVWTICVVLLTCQLNGILTWGQSSSSSNRSSSNVLSEARVKRFLEEQKLKGSDACKDSLEYIKGELDYSLKKRGGRYTILRCSLVGVKSATPAKDLGGTVMREKNGNIMYYETQALFQTRIKMTGPDEHTYYVLLYTHQIMSLHPRGAGSDALPPDSDFYLKQTIPVDYEIERDRTKEQLLAEIQAALLAKGLSIFADSVKEFFQPSPPSSSSSSSRSSTSSTSSPSSSRSSSSYDGPGVYKVIYKCEWGLGYKSTSTGEMETLVYAKDMMNAFDKVYQDSKLKDWCKQHVHSVSPTDDGSASIRPKRAILQK